MELYSQSTPTWVRVENCVLIQGADGRLVRPNAMEIYHSVFRRVTDFRGEPTSNSVRDADPSLDFSRGAAPVACLVEGSTAGPIANLCVAVEGGVAVINADQDQIIIGDCWYPVDLSAIESCIARLGALGVPIGEPMSLRNYMDLRSISGREFSVVDNADAATFRNTDSLEHLAGVNAALYAYQVTGVSYLKLIARHELGCVLADEMGLGKTLQILALLNEIKCEGGGPCLVVCPSSLLENWRREAATFTPEMTVAIHSGPMRPGIASMLGRVDITVVSYDTLVRDQQIFLGRQWHVVVLDEAQAIKNPDSLRARAVSSLRRRVAVAVTGTPLENRLEDLWSIMEFVAPWLLGPMDVFLATYDREDASSDLAKLISPLILRRRVVEVADDLPPRIEIPQYLLMPGEMAAAYEKVRAQAHLEFRGSGALVALTRLRALCAEVVANDVMDRDVKFERLLGIVEEAFFVGEKVLIFGSFRRTADRLCENLGKVFPTAFFSVIDGRTASDERQQIIDSFFAHEGAGALILNPRAAGAGLNITAANHVVHYNPEWNPALTAQASARAYRRRQTKPVTIHHLIFANTVEEVIRDVSVAKATLADTVIEGTDGSIPSSALAAALSISPLVDLL